MKRRVQMFFSVVMFLGLLAAAAAVDAEVQYWNATGTDQVTPDWARWLALGMVILAVSSPILTWPRREKRGHPEG
jgi:type VI protein secretion system component VasK